MTRGGKTNRDKRDEELDVLKARAGVLSLVVLLALLAVEMIRPETYILQQRTIVILLALIGGLLKLNLGGIFGIGNSTDKSERDRRTDGGRPPADPAEQRHRPVIHIITRLFVIFSSVVLVALTIAPILLNNYAAFEVYTFLLRASIAWCGFIWICTAMWASLMSYDGEYASTVWISFAIGAIMIYIAVGGAFTDSTFWMGARTMLYLLLSMVTVFVMEEIRERSDAPHITGEFRNLLSPRRVIARLRR